MPSDTGSFESSRQSAWPWRAGIVVDDPGLTAEIAAALGEVRATCVFQVAASVSVLEIFALIERDRPDLLFVELSAASLPPGEWMSAVQGADGLPLVAAVHTSADPAHMISALRAGACEFLSLPLNPAIFGALDRIAARLGSSRPPEAAHGKIIGIVSAKGGCGATTMACHLGGALGQADPSPEAGTALPEPWRIESLFRHLTRSYPLVLADPVRQLNPGSWAFLRHLDELLVVTAPDVLALYQTRYILQTLTSRGFERTRIRLILSMSENTPRDFWIDSVEQMFEMRLFGVIPTDRAALDGIPKDRLVFPLEMPFGKAVAKIAARLTVGESAGPSRRAA